MALLSVKFRSQVLQLCCSAEVILPENRVSRDKLKVLWLLHGLSDDHTAWTRQTSIERYVAGLDLAVIMPAVDRSFYTDMAWGNRYYTYVTEELPRVMGAMFPISDRREDNYVAGLSMGGYGAFKIALNNADRYCAAASLSGALDIAEMARDHNRSADPELNRLFTLVFGSLDKFEKSINDLRCMAELVAIHGNCPRLYMCCGTADFLYDINLRYFAHLKGLDLPVTYEEDPGYDHNWGYWDMKIPQVINWMLQRG